MKKEKHTTEEILKIINQEHNHSWYVELYERNKNNLDDIAIIYRGNKITYGQMFENMKIYAKSLKTLGLNESSEIPVCVSNSPEIVYIMGAASMIGARVNIFGQQFPLDYITKIINSCNSSVMFVEDNNYLKIKQAIDNSKIKKVIVNSLSDSLKDGINPYDKFDPSKLFDSKVKDIKGNDERVVSQEEFKTIGESYDGKLIAETPIDHDFVITYTSGSTNEDRPKAIIHSSRNFITVARYHDKDINGINSKPFTSLAHIPTYSNTNLVSCISDSLMQGAKLALEPIYDKDHFIISMLIYKPHYVAATKSFWINAAKQILYDERYKNIRLENLLLAFSCGETFEINEEKFINKALKKAKTGTKVTHTSFSVIKMSEAAGDCEHGSIFYTIFRAYQNLKPTNYKTKDAEGLIHFPFVEVAVLKDNGELLGRNQLGKIVANSPCTMKGYKDNVEATNKFFIKDETGKIWADMNLYGYLDDYDKVHIRGRYMQGEIIHPSTLAKLILKDTKNILSCEVVKSNIEGVYIAHIEMSPEARKGTSYILYSAMERCRNILNELGIELYYRVRTNEESYPLTKSGKRDVKKLVGEGLTEKCVKARIVDGEYRLVNYNENVDIVRKRIK